MANEGSTKPTYSELEAENLRVRGLLQRQWISVEERLPEENAYVLSYNPEYGPGPADGIAVGKSDGKRGVGPGNGNTHWMPLPAPPNFRESSSLVSQGAESADIGKLDTAPEKAMKAIYELREELLDYSPSGAKPSPRYRPGVEIDELAGNAESGVEMGKVNRVDDPALTCNCMNEMGLRFKITFHQRSCPMWASPEILPTQLPKE